MWHHFSNLLFSSSQIQITVRVYCLTEINKTFVGSIYCEGNEICILKAITCICHISPAAGHTLSDNICWRVRNSNMMEHQNERSDVPDLICSTPHTGRYLSDLVCTDQACWNWTIRYANVLAGLRSGCRYCNYCHYKVCIYFLSDIWLNRKAKRSQKSHP